MPKQIISLSSAPTVGITPGQSVSPLAQAIRFGNMLFVSGQGSVDPATGTVVEGDIAVQTRLALDNLMSVLAAAGATAKNVVNMRVTLRDVADFPRFNETFREYFDGEKVTRTCFGGTPNRAGVNVQIDCIAMFDQPVYSQDPAQNPL
jgi:2-iminobutanoate/2-iminopropanoate deaminase